MDVKRREIDLISVKLDNSDMRLLIEGERLLFDIDKSFYLEIYHTPTIEYDTDSQKPYINGENNSQD